MMADGHLNKCKECTRFDVRANYQANAEHYAAYERKRFQTPERKAWAKEQQRKHRERYPEKAKARQAVANAIRDGRLTRKPCQVCGSPHTHAHHTDYSRPLDVQWLCFTHHMAAHGKQVRTV